jgi:predicted DNA-binding transcriptional regulator YafY
MDKMERLYALHTLFDGRRRPVPMAEIVERLECSPATAKRAIREFRMLGAPLDYDPALGGYRYTLEEGQRRFELPGLWFRVEEIAALATLRELLARLEPGVLAEVLSPLARRLEELFSRRRLDIAEVGRRVRIISQHARSPGPALGPVALAVLSRKRLAFVYTRRGNGATGERLVSPQRVTRYRGCWYLDAWCHDREALRTFAVERIADPRVLSSSAVSRPESELDAHYADAYGIFAGPATETAVLRITGPAARWIADEMWHPRQTGIVGDDGSYELRVPYGRPEELIRDILRLGPDAEVLAPDSLRRDVATRLRGAAERYSDD